MGNLIRITGEQFTIESFRAGWADDEKLTAAQVSACADAEYAWLVNYTGEHLRGWSYDGDGFTGPWRDNDILDKIAQLSTLATDYVLANFADIVALDDED